MLRAAAVDGVTGLCAAVMTAGQYDPDNLGRDVNRGSAVGMFEGMRSLPWRLPIYAVAGLPSAADHTGAIVYCSNGAAGTPCVAFSNGSAWKRADSPSTTVSAT
jgi:hypothetical protein